MSFAYDQKKARELAFSICYQSYYLGSMPLSYDYLCHKKRIKGEAKIFLDDLLKLVKDKNHDIGVIISDGLVAWKQSQIDPLLSAILQVAVAEFIYLKPADFKISINEAVEFSKQYISHATAKMSNAILDNIRLKYLENNKV